MSALSALYGRVARLRRAWYASRPERQRRLGRPVISIGSLSVGGSGKTPLTEAIARLLQHQGERPVILSRGYGRRSSAAVVIVSDRQQVLVSATASGDEPQMLARALPGVPVVVGAHRHAAGRLAEAQFDPTVLLLDDAFQHLGLARDLDLLLVGAEDLLESVLPAGRLREPLDAARTADALLVEGTVDDARQVATALGVAHVFSVRRHYESLRPLGTAVADSTTLIAGTAAAACRRAVVCAGIARPQRFFAAVRAQGWQVTRELPFKDHHWFTARDLSRIARAAHDTGADLVITTDKDAVRLECAAGWRDVQQDLAWAALPMRVHVDPAEGFASWLRDRLLRRTGRRADRVVG